MKIDKITIHCSASSDKDSSTVNVDTIRRWHLKRRFRDVGYHYVIPRNAQLEIGRPSNEQGAHVRGYNKGNLGICIVGTMHFNKRQIKTLVRTVKALMKEYNLKPKDVYCHNEFTKKKTCPNIPGEVIRYMLSQ